MRIQITFKNISKYYYMSDKKESKCKTYECKKCNFVTSYANSYKRHIINNKHNGRRTEKTPEIFKCNHCDYTSIYKHNRDNHYYKNHATEKERKEHFAYYCETCRFGTKSISDNETHINSSRHKRLVAPLTE